MPIFNIPLPSNEPKDEEIMILWSVYEITYVDKKYHHLVGYLAERQTGRVMCQH